MPIKLELNYPRDLTPEDLSAQVELLAALDKEDPIEAHEQRADIVYLALQAIADGAAQPDLLASIALTIDPFQVQH